MPFDPNFPPDHQELDAAPFRDQFNALKALNDAVVDGSALQDTFRANVSGSSLPVDYLRLTVSNPPTQAQMQAIADKIDEMLMYQRWE
jgi:hypothetical protein